jgi:hypothetical protein
MAQAISMAETIPSCQAVAATEKRGRVAGVNIKIPVAWGDNQNHVLPGGKKQPRLDR